ncbi:MAG: efflux RND transporter periplasmic adaptor subunit [Pseudomonadaceae bacterium]|jgi:membrane fusion protein (multidrug efflux system)|uniref:efflux RND transporter periplasmic adaptor subunit n=1 Tax=Pseudomonas TaxID=286 RepID=UPI0008E4CC8B|nr:MULTISPECIES: efflux RND transporter periplasmic adaptor subunit [Pseudomonas]MBQ56331.1 efflux RND transporter periplasmic adaptor subunit [Pseudomonadaceae bacterium]NRH28270.1 efflux RND transporter periplasmic adaptor subunit [Pseudomonas sp. MS19]SFU01324.1 membrane fusion protein, multidrug efflux system [Pseudomonas marincola]HCP56033.1 efflux RND transporter periplasmic adaptor subunit [Pseudomonas sp.]
MLLRRMLMMLGAVLIVVLALGGYKGYSIYQQVQQFSKPKPAISITAATAEKRPWQQRLAAIGTLKAFQGVDLTVEVSGIVRDVLFTSGQHVNKDQPLVQLNNEVEQANLATAQANLNLARVEYNRGKTLVGRQNISKSEFDRLAAQLQTSQASVDQIKALLDKKRILAPFNGTIGVRQIDVGNFLASGTLIATLQDTSQLYLDFYLPEQSVPKLHLGETVQFKVAAYPDEHFTGEIAAINPKVEDTTRNVLVRAQLKNPGNKLFPGMFASLDVLLPESPDQVLLPETAVVYTLYGNSVYVISEQKDDDGQVVNDDNGQAKLVVERRIVETGERRDGQVVVLDGLEPGERVAATGQLKLDNGAHVSIVTEPASKATKQ